MPGGPSFPTSTGFGCPFFFVFEGDSLTADNLDGIRPFPTELLSLTPYSAGYHFNRAVGGQRTDQMITQYTSALREFYQAHLRAKQGYYFIWAGINNYAAGDGNIEILNDLLSLWGAAKADGFTVIASTLGPVSGWPVNEPVWEANRQGLNTVLRALQDGSFDLLMDPDDWLPDAFDTDYYYDGQHLTQAGTTFVANKIAQEVLPNP